jgi:hypothetical protein
MGTEEGAHLHGAVKRAAGRRRDRFEVGESLADLVLQARGNQCRRP